MNTAVRHASPSDAESIAAIHREAFPRQGESEAWVKATLAAAPRMLAFVLELGGTVVGYIFWAQKSGIRPAAVVELDQVAVVTKLRRTGLGEMLIRESLALVVRELSRTGQSIKTILVSTRADNEAQRLYARVLGAKVVSTIDGLYSGAEVLMLAEGPDV